jgi:SOS-response transcriptional repressor LexA
MNHETKSERLRRARKAAGYDTASAAARAGGWKIPTYQGHENGWRDFDEIAAENYAQAYNVDPSWILYGKGKPPRNAQSNFRVISSPERFGDGKQSATIVDMPAGTLAIRGTVAAGTWLEIDAMSLEEPIGSVPIPPDPSHQNASSFGLVVSGTSINRIAADGDVLVCLSTLETGYSPRDGDLVIVERRRAQEGLIEVTAKRFYRFHDRVELSPESTDPKWQSPIVIRHEDVSDGKADVRVIAVVRWIYKTVPPPDPKQ